MYSLRMHLRFTPEVLCSTTIDSVDAAFSCAPEVMLESSTVWYEK